MRKVLIALCLVWGLGITVPIHADGETQTNPSTITLTIDDALKDHTFTAYQIFTGDVNEHTLSNVKWGDGMTQENQATLIEYLVENGALSTASGATAKEVAEAISKYTNNGTNSTNSREVSSWIAKNINGTGTEITSNTISLTPGYYLIVDTTPEATSDKSFVWNESLLQLTDNMVISPKVDTPSVTKTAKDNETNEYKNVVDSSIGDTVEFQYISKVPDTTHYSEYKYIFHDTLSRGLRLNNDSINVKVGETDADNTGYELNINQNPSDGCSFHVEVSNLKGKDNQNVRVTYSATLTSDAFVGLLPDTDNDEVPNTNSVFLEYSNHPYDTTKTGKTPEDEVYVYTYKIAGTKVDAKDKVTPLKGAEFVLFKNTTNENGTEVKSYAQMDGTTHKLTQWVTDEENASHLVSNGEGKFEILGLDAGTYYLKEIKAPTGYNIMDAPQEVVVSKEKNTTTNDSSGDGSKNTTSNDTNVASSTVDGNGTVTTIVENGKGFEMPSTGAVGQTMIYGAGALLAIGGLSIRVIRHRKED